MNTYPFFSIITPVYNVRRFLKKCIQSVIEQTYSSWELILIDDGSTDSSGKICDSFLYDKRIKVIHQENEGEYSSRLSGIKIATGVYTLGLDADDYLDKTCLEKIKKSIEISGSDLIFFGYRTVGSYKSTVRCTLEAGKKFSRKEILKEVIEQTNHSLCNKAIKTDVMKKAKYMKRGKKLSINADYVQIISILCEIKSGYVIEDILYNYRIHRNSASHSCKIQHIYDTGFVTAYAIRKLNRYSILDTEICNLINIAYLKMIAPRLLILFDHKKISRKDCENIHKSKIYKESRRVESLKYVNKCHFFVLKLFRYRQYWGLKLIAQFQKL